MTASVEFRTEPWSKYRRADELVLATQTLRPDADPERLSRFGDDRWDLRPAIFRENVPRGLTSVDFGVIADPLQRLTAKEFLWARMNEASPLPTQPRMAPTTARTTLTGIASFMDFVARECGRFSMHAVDQPLLDAHLAELKSKQGRTAERITHLLAYPILLDRYGPYLTLGGFSCQPWRGRPAAQVAGSPRKSLAVENRTPRIPEPVIGALLHWSLKYIDLFSSDIFAARADLEAFRAARLHNASTGDYLTDRLDLYIGRRCAAGRGIPLRLANKGGYSQPPPDGRMNFELIALQLGCKTAHLLEPVRRKRLDRAFARLGGESGGMDSKVSLDPDTGRPWRDRFDQDSVAREERMLQAAAYVVCAYLTGMRDSELQAMRVGCCTTVRSADGLVERHQIRSTVYKMRAPTGEEAEWITIAPAVRAVAVAERLSERQRATRGIETTWQSLSMASAASAELRMGIGPLINDLRDRIDGMAADGQAIPQVDGASWWFTTRQFRRTLAWHVANRPFGTVAGKIQHKHTSIAMFEGYSGSSPSGFRQEVEQERALGQLDDVVEHYEQAVRHNLPPAGPAAARLRAEFTRIRDELGDLPGRIVEPQRLRAMLAHLGRTLHVGLLADCFFDPDTALCLDQDKDDLDRTMPALSQCRPDRCPNACITRRHLPPWQASIAEAGRLLEDHRLSPLQRTALTQDIERMRRLIAPLLEGTNA
ncbi:hypothetical protein [Mesorhizobium sp. J428]|uniref:hypothetical protein n=1 Tax=Mesorhizobium sp. J428 TaxID=2898440 RepID=UPI002150FF26|nr:hypothetical protein [Mesorhizobium sp. J428]MCR5857374.1 hypothetical protein [Mesorhizobium sp. J428]